MVGMQRSTEELREKVGALSDDFKKRLVYLEVKDVLKIGQLLSDAIQILAPLRLSSS